MASRGLARSAATPHPKGSGMKAVVYTTRTAGCSCISEVPTPTPKNNEVLIRVHAAAVTTTDCNLRGGDPADAARLRLRKPKRSVLGTEFAGEIEAVGTDVQHYRVGDQVFAATGAGFGAHAEYICLPEDGALAPNPPMQPMQKPPPSARGTDGSSVPARYRQDPAWTPRRDQRRVWCRGRVCRPAGQGLRSRCHRSLWSHERELVRSLGADTVIDYSKEDFTRTGQLYDIIFDAVGKSSFSRCKGSLKPGGVYLATVPSLALYAHVLRTAKSGGKKAKVAATGLRPASEKAKTSATSLSLLRRERSNRPSIAAIRWLRYAAHRHVETGHKKRGTVVITMDNATEPAAERS